jgi:hypothetical protein
MMKYLNLIICGALLAGLTGCSTVGKLTGSDLVAPGLAVGGATLGAFATEDEDSGTRLAATAGGGLIGYLTGLFFSEGAKSGKKEEFRSGYELGQSNATKSLYWNIQKLHEAQNQPESKVVYYQIPVDYPDDGAKRTPGSVVMPIVQSNSR